MGNVADEEGSDTTILGSEAPSEGDGAVGSRYLVKRRGRRAGKAPVRRVRFRWGEPGERDQAWLGVLAGFTPFADPGKVIDSFYNCTVKLRVRLSASARPSNRARLEGARPNCCGFSWVLRLVPRARVVRANHGF